MANKNTNLYSNSDVQVNHNNLYTEQSKWLVIRRMVSEKYLELHSIINDIFYNDYRNKHIKNINDFIRSKFIPKDMEEELTRINSRGKVVEKEWLDELSAVDLLNVYSYLNQILNCLYYYTRTNIEVKTASNDEIYMYNVNTPSKYYYEDNAVSRYNNFLWRIKNKDLAVVNPYFSKNVKKRTIQLNPKGTNYCKDAPLLPAKNTNYRKSVVALLIKDAISRYAKINKVETPNFEEAKQTFFTKSTAGNGVVMGFSKDDIPDPDVDMLFGESLIQRMELAGLINGCPVYKDGVGNYYDWHNNEIAIDDGCVPYLDPED